MTKRLTNSRGSSAIEFAIILPVLVLLLFGMVEFGLLFYNQQIITNASREAARAGIVAGSPRPTDGDIQGVVTNYAADHLITFGEASVPAIEINPAGDRTGLLFGQNLTVRVSYNYGFLVLANFGFSPINLRAETVMKLE